MKRARVVAIDEDVHLASRPFASPFASPLPPSELDYTLFETKEIPYEVLVAHVKPYLSIPQLLRVVECSPYVRDAFRPEWAPSVVDIDDNEDTKQIAVPLMSCAQFQVYINMDVGDEILGAHVSSTHDADCAYALMVQYHAWYHQAATWDVAVMNGLFTHDDIDTLVPMRQTLLYDRMLWLYGILRKHSVRMIDSDDPNTLTEYDTLNTFELCIRKRVSGAAEWLTRRRYLVACARGRPRIQAQHRHYYWHTLLRASPAPMKDILRLPLPSSDNYFLLPQLNVLTRSIWGREYASVGRIRFLMHLQGCTTLSPVLRRLFDDNLSLAHTKHGTDAAKTPFFLDVIALHAKFRIATGLSEECMCDLLKSEACCTYPREVTDALVRCYATILQWTPLQELEALSRVINGLPPAVRLVLEQRLDRLRTTIYLPTIAISQ